VTGLLRSGAYEPPAAVVSAPDLSRAVDPSIPPALLNLAADPGPSVSRDGATPERRQDSPNADSTSRGLSPGSAALRRCRRAWARTQMQLELEVWPA
jgi:hypothetical protein